MRITLVIATLFALGSLGCDTDVTEPAAEEIGSIVEAGKADDFLSASAQEYYVEGSATITLGDAWHLKSEDEQRTEIRRLIPFKQVVTGWFLNIYLVDKDDHDKTGETYGGFKALTKNGSYEDLDIRLVDESTVTWAFDFRQEIGGQNDLIGALPDAKSSGDGSWVFPLVVGKIGVEEMQQLETDKEWYRKSPWGSFNPANVDAERLETMTLTIRPEPASEDAWLETDRLFEDGKLSVGMHFGWDYHNAYHEVHSKEIYDWLVGRGFKSPVDSWADLTHNAGPLTGTTKYRGKTVTVEVSIFWGRTGDATDPDTAAGGKQLEADMLDSLANREVVVFNGHSGPFYGFALANWKKTAEGDLDDSELATVPLNTGVYQLVVAEGCDTYALGQAFYDNPFKDGLTDLDVITTTSFSNASTANSVKDVMNRLLGERGGQVSPSLFSTLLRDLDNNSYWFSSMYGVHGIDDNPKVHPFADLNRVCTPCTSHSACGDGMQCVRMVDGERACVAECTASTGCGAGFACRNVQSSGWLRHKVCAPNGLACVATPPPATVVVLNEVGPSPTSDLDADGELSARGDEFIEVVNASTVAVDLSGWSLSDNVGVRHVFGPQTLLYPGGAVVVFGSRAPKLVAGSTPVVGASSGRLGLNDGGDKVRLADLDGVTVDEITYDAALRKGASFGRSTDGSPAALWLGMDSPTPGFAQDGTLY
ncbi:MAG: hypothetical protein ACI9MR_002149 [Myxococcota bacterium]|jgi:hypothetical protein